MNGVAREQRHTRANRCPICDGADGDPRGAGKRCSGFTTADGYAHCSREELAGSIVANGAGLFAHRLAGDCHCGTSHGPSVASASDIVATYDYRDERGALLFQVVRKVGKKFLQRKPDPTNPGDWIWSVKGERLVPYRLPELIAADPAATVYICEGERDVDTAIGLGLVATCNPMGASKFSTVAELAAKLLRGRLVVVVADADDVGRRHAAEVQRSLAGAAKRVRVVECPDGHKDLSAWVAAGATVEDVRTRCEGEPTGNEDGPLADLRNLASVAVVGSDRIKALAEQPVRYIWEDIAILGIIVVLAGGPGCGKTTLLFLILVARMTMGAPVNVLGRKVSPSPPGMFVVLIEGEHGEASAARKLVRTCALLGVDETALDRVILIARKSVRIGSPAWEDIVTLISRGLVSDIAIDTLPRVAPADANDEADQVAIFDRVATAVDSAPDEATKPVVWVNTHTKKGADDDLDGVSGSAQRTGQADTVLMVKAERRDGRVTSSRVTFQKLREEPDNYPSPVDFTVTSAGVVVVGASGDDDKRPLEERILERLQLGPRTKNKLCSELGRNPPDVDAAITNLFDARRLTTTQLVVRGRTFKAFDLRNDTLRTPYVARTANDTQRHPTDPREAGNRAD